MIAAVHDPMLRAETLWRGQAGVYAAEPPSIPRLGVRDLVHMGCAASVLCVELKYVLKFELQSHCSSVSRGKRGSLLLGTHA